MSKKVGVEVHLIALGIGSVKQCLPQETNVLSHKEN